jgi:hypothetical protein
MTSLFRELVSVPTEPCFSIRTVDDPSRDWSRRAIAKPTTPPPITACVKSAVLGRLVENDREVNDLGNKGEITREANMMEYSAVIRNAWETWNEDAVEKKRNGNISMHLNSIADEVRPYRYGICCFSDDVTESPRHASRKDPSGIFRRQVAFRSICIF